MAHETELFFKPEEYVDIPVKDLLSWIFDDVPFDERKPIYIDASNPNRRISSLQARSLIRKLVAGFRAMGLKKGDCVCLHAFNDIYYPIVFLGVIAAGGVWTGTNPSYTNAELVHHFTVSNCKFVLTEPGEDMFKTIHDAAITTGIKKENILVFDILSQFLPLPAGFQSWKSLLSHGEQDWVRFDSLEECKNTTAALMFSSGTTGIPKAAMWSHYNLIAQHTLVHEQTEVPWEIKRLLCLPFFHGASVPVGHVTPLRAGHLSYVMRRFDLENFLRYLQQYEIPELSIVPPIVIATIMSPLTKRYSLSKAITAFCGSAPLDKFSQQRFLSLMGPDSRFTQVWGMTETTCVATRFQWPEKDSTGSVGRFVPNMEAKLVDDNGNEIRAYDVPGELCVRGPLVIRGYFQNPQADAEAFKDGWFHTGDVAYCAADSKKWYIVDRKKELIKVRGFQVAPLELESVLLSHPRVVDAAVIGVYPNGVNGGEVPRAYVVERPGIPGPGLTAAELKDYLGSRLAKYKSLEGGIVFMKAIPKNTTGKVIKKLLREQAAKELASKF